MECRSWANPNDLGPLPEGWSVKTIEELCERVASGGTPSRRISAFFENGVINWFKTKELRDGYLDESEERITRDAVNASSAKLLPPDTVLMAMYGDGRTITSLGILRHESTCNQACCAMICDQSMCDSRFLFYALKHHRDDFIQIASGGAQRNLSGGLIRRFAIKTPPLAEQHTIAHILGTLDDKIELNRKMNTTLDELARTLFRSWFVNFDPVRAKAEGRQPEGMDAATAAHFPDRFVDSELGPVPKGWDVRSLDEIATFLNGLALQKFPPAEDGPNQPVIKIAQLRKRNVEGASLANSDVPEAFVVQDGDVLFSWSGSLEAVIWGGGTGALNQHLFKVTSEAFPKWFYYYWIHHHLPEFRGIAAGKATTMGHIQRRHLTQARVVCPPPSVLGRLDAILAPLLERFIKNLQEQRALAETRDVLLPALLSGRLRVPDAERLVGASM